MPLVKEMHMVGEKKVKIGNDGLAKRKRLSNLEPLILKKQSLSTNEFFNPIFNLALLNYLIN